MGEASARGRVVERGTRCKKRREPYEALPRLSPHWPSFPNGHLSPSYSHLSPPTSLPDLQYDHVKRAAACPGPGAYTLTNAVGVQVASTKPSTPRFGFGSSNRDHMAKVREQSWADARLSPALRPCA